MVPTVLISVLFAQTVSGELLRSDLVSAAAASPRPDVCLRRSTQQGPSPWQRAKHPGVARYCQLLARGYSKLAEDPKAALSVAERAGGLLPGRAAPSVLAARALAALGEHQKAWQRFEKALELDGRSVEAPAALHDLALTAAMTGRYERAIDAYRALVPRVPILDEPWHRQRVYVEAAVLAMTRGEAMLDEAVGYLTEARRRGSPPGFSDYVLAALALALDRQGRREEAAGVAARASGPWMLERLLEPEDDGPERASPPFLPPGELHALVAILAEHEDTDLARQQWQEFIEARPDSPFVGHARAKLSGKARGFGR